jgi:hypothetical protein
MSEHEGGGVGGRPLYIPWEFEAEIDNPFEYINYLIGQLDKAEVAVEELQNKYTAIQRDWISYQREIDECEMTYEDAYYLLKRLRS